MCSCNSCCHGNITIHSLCIIVELHAALNGVKLLSAAMEMHDWNPFVLLLSNKIIHTAVNNMNLLSCIANDDQQDATILVYLFISNQLYMFRAMSLPVIRST